MSLPIQARAPHWAGLLLGNRSPIVSCSWQGGATLLGDGLSLQEARASPWGGQELAMPEGGQDLASPLGSHPYPHPLSLVKLPASRAQTSGKDCLQATCSTRVWLCSEVTKFIIGRFCLYVGIFLLWTLHLFFRQSWEDRNRRDYSKDPQIVCLGPASLF